MGAQQQLRRIDLDKLRTNVRLIRSSLPHETKIMAVVKADAYGHGMIPVACAAREAGADAFAVARVPEAIALSDAGLAPILVLGLADPDEYATALMRQIHLTVCTCEQIAHLHHLAQRMDVKAYVHIKLDTGMGRIGAVTEEEVSRLAEYLRRHDRVCLCGVYTHFAGADDPSEESEAFTLQQKERFDHLCHLLPEGTPRHCNNSAALHTHPEWSMDMVRLGISMYGYPPVETPLPLQPVMDWRTAVTHVKECQPGDVISYGSTFTVEKPMTIATIACGYGDGYHRSASGKAQVLLHGQRAPVVGRICMDQMMVDVTHIPDVAPGDEVILMGGEGDNAITAQDIAAWADTICYEVLLLATNRVERIWCSALADKQTLRRMMKALRPDEETRRRESEQICRHLMCHAEIQSARVIAAYLPLPWEADITPVIRELLAQKKTVLLPRTGEAPHMDLCPVTDLSALTPGPFGIPEPGPDAPTCDPDDIDVVLVPLEAVDSRGVRLGKGRGFYDHALKKVHDRQGRTIGIAMSHQQLRVEIPLEEHDEPLMAVCTPNGLKTFPALPERNP